MIQIGLEKEFFLVDAKGEPVALVNPVTVDTVPERLPLSADDCGMLVEARGKPFESPCEAVFSLMADVHRLEMEVVNLNPRLPQVGQKIAGKDPIFVAPLKLDETPIMKVARSMRLVAQRVFTKPTTKYRNLYGYADHRQSLAEQTAGIHVSFTCPVEATLHDKMNGYKRTFNLNFDWAQIFIALDHAFEGEIAAARRRPGFYEMKHDGRVEYRSLPSNVDLNKLIQVLSEIVKN